MKFSWQPMLTGEGGEAGCTNPGGTSGRGEHSITKVLREEEKQPEMQKQTESKEIANAGNLHEHCL